MRAETARQRRRSGGVAQNLDERIANVAYLLGASDERAKEVVAMHDAAAEKSKEAKRKAAVDDAVEAAVAIALKEVEAEVRDVCLLSAPTGCASFQLKFGASTLHRAFGVPVGYCGPWKNRADGRFRKMKTRLDQAKLFVMDEMSMIGRSMLGRIEFKIRNTLYDDTRRLGEEVTVAGRRVMTTLGGKDVVMSGDFKQANPIGDDPMYKLGEYVGKGQNKPKHAERTPDNAWTTKNLHRMGMAVRDQFEDVCLLRKVHRHNEKKDGLSDAEQEKYRQDADRYRRVMMGMADCDPALFTKDDHDEW